MNRTAVAAAVRRAVDLSGGELLMLVNDLANAASMRSGGGSALQLAATEEEVRMRYLAIRLEQLCAEILAAVPFDIEEPPA
jgi:hypothetical protein